MKTLQELSDRALRMFVPKREAGACQCSATPYYQYRCTFSPHEWQRRTCTNNCACVPTCTAWVRLSGTCPAV